MANTIRKAQALHKTSSAAIVATGNACRITGVALAGDGTNVGNVALKTGGSGGTAVLTLYCGPDGGYYADIPGRGIYSASGIYATITNLGGVTVFYEIDG